MSVIARGGRPMADESLVISSGWYEAVDIPRGWRLVFSFDGRALEAKVLPGANGFGWRLFVGNKPIRVAGGSRLDFDSPEQARAQGLRALEEIVRLSSQIE